MKTYHCKFMRQFDADIHAENAEIAQALAHQVLAQFPPNTARLLSVIEEGYVEKPCIGCEEDGPKKPPPHRPTNNPSSGGTPGTPVVRTEELVDQIAEVA